MFSPFSFGYHHLPFILSTPVQFPGTTSLIAKSKIGHVGGDYFPTTFLESSKHVFTHVNWTHNRKHIHMHPYPQLNIMNISSPRWSPFRLFTAEITSLIGFSQLNVFKFARQLNIVWSINLQIYPFLIYYTSLILALLFFTPFVVITPWHHLCSKSRKTHTDWKFFFNSYLTTFYLMPIKVFWNGQEIPCRHELKYLQNWGHWCHPRIIWQLSNSAAFLPLKSIFWACLHFFSSVTNLAGRYLPLKLWDSALQGQILCKSSVSIRESSHSAHFECWILFTQAKFSGKFLQIL